MNISPPVAIISDIIYTVHLKPYFHIKYIYINISLAQYNGVQLKPYLHIKDIKTIYNK